MEIDFFSKYLLSLFSEKTYVSAKQLNLIAKAKRTPSVLFNVEKNKLYALFGLFPDIALKKWEETTSVLIDKDLLSRTDGHMRLTKKGFIVKSSFLEKFPNFNNLNQLSYSGTIPIFFNRLVFITQILSEYSYSNKNYSPYLSSVNDQIKIKKWLVKQALPMDTLIYNWSAELSTLFRHLPANEADFIAEHFTGYMVHGETSRQIQEKYNYTQEEYSIRLTQFNNRIITLDSKINPLLSSLLRSTHKDCNEGLSYSANLTKQWLERGKEINEVAKIRKLKPNTIKEHILECVLILNWPHFKRYVPYEKYSACHELFEKHSAVKYSEAKDMIKELDFFTFRLVEIERIRHDE
ncbi:MAG: helix-turn-helix domain-containing protein [Alkalibacterium gilvum]|uniref:Uncharacterized protein YpbB n=1 Tax=Alkalibacterium gilvum TaxID=1130080 RepID=A0A1H6R4Q7_9LACT|nr:MULTISPECIES: helix-turn-helix domain-containing protein [Alkalibacterium]MDN6293639.1 helix-turn-helix domain-containing protein [Alkalibacterium sp.]MDN6295373.1 helix-turn-helix domain-containing protein [Alkalibacterium sp.]MDN6398441.1 helix-turn-helix domain-containing protein [Alkalibacterium sp.]SEI48204.1 Uncharacterized protein YpbB [Alkalibacterium gilvum]HAJ69814.1 hypothetical protein [Alkalibacterium sp.]